MNVLLLTPLPPCAEFTGCILLESMCRFLPKGSITSFSPIDAIPAHLTIADELADMHIACEGPAMRTAEAMQKVKAPAVAGITALLERSIGWQRIVDAAVKVGVERNVDRVWCVLQGPLLCRLGLAVAQRLGVPLHTQVWDYPAYWIQMHGFGRTATRSMLNDFQNSVRSSSCVAAASVEMAHDLTTTHGCPAVPITGALDPYATNLRVDHTDFTNNEISIGMAGQLYASGAWSALLRALDTVDWTIAGKRVRLRYLGYNQPLPTDFINARSRNACVEFLGYRPTHDVVRALSDCDLLYVPFFSGELFETLTQTSFPAKVATYLAAGRPVLFHGPPYAPAANFLTNADAGVVCNSLEPAHITDAIAQMTTDPARYRALTQNARRAFDDNLTLDTLRKHTIDFITAPPRDVRGIA